MVGVIFEVEVCQVGGARAVDVQLREWAANLLVGQELGLGSCPVDVTSKLLRRNTSDLNKKDSPILRRIKRLYSPQMEILCGSQFYTVNPNAQKIKN